MKYVIERERAMEIVKDWHAAPKSKKGIVSCKIMRRYCWVYREGDYFGAIDNRAGLCEVEDDFRTIEGAEEWLEERGKKHG